MFYNYTTANDLYTEVSLKHKLDKSFHEFKIRKHNYLVHEFSPCNIIESLSTIFITVNL